MKPSDLAYLERKICIGLIANTEYLSIAINIIQLKYVNSSEAELIMSWCFEYFNKYKKAPKEQIQDIYLDKIRETNIPKQKAQLVEEILSSLSDEYSNSNINVQYLKEQTITYSKICKLHSYVEEIRDEIDTGNILEAESLLSKYKPIEESVQSNAVIPLQSTEQIKEAFTQSTKPLIKYPGPLGNLLNQSMTKESFVAFMGESKGGKSWILLDAMFRAAKQNKNVVFIQCGDMSQAQMERRQAIYLMKKSDMKQYCGVQYIPVLDCIYNQNGDCTYDHRENKDNSFPFDGMKEKEIKNINKEELINAFNSFPEHTVCYNCKRKGIKGIPSFKGCIWYKKKEETTPLTWKECSIHIKRKYKTLLSKIRLITYPSETLTMKMIESELDILEKTGFTSEVIILDYMDLLSPDNDTKKEATRDRINIKWQRGRRLSQERKVLFLTATQSDAQGFNKLFLGKDNFNNDRRILDHVTAMFGINMTINEKKKGILRINDIIGRETEGGSYVNIMHRLQIGSPILGSFY